MTTELAFHELRLRQEDLTRLRMTLGLLGRKLRQQSTGEFSYALASLLFSIHRSQPVSVGRLAADEGISPPSVTRTLKRLFLMGLISREPLLADRRSVTIRLTEQGRAKRDELLQKREIWLTEHIGHLTDCEVAEILGSLPILDKLCFPVREPSDIRIEVADRAAACK